MTLVRCVTEMDMGEVVHRIGLHHCRARPVFDAIHHSSLGFPRLVGKIAEDMRLRPESEGS
jgi:hypothetical protein